MPIREHEHGMRVDLVAAPARYPRTPLLLLLLVAVVLSGGAGAIDASCSSVPRIPVVGTTSFSVFSQVSGRPPSARINETWFDDGPAGECRKNGLAAGGKTVLLVGFGSGFVWASSLVRM